MVRIVTFSLFIMLFLTSMVNATTTARFNRDTIHLNETVELIIESDQSSISKEAELDALEQDFRIVNRRRDTNVTINNGKSQLVHRWRTQLSPLAVGSFSVGPIKVGDEETNRLRLTVLPEAEQPDSGKEVFIELEIDNETVYVQQQILLTANLFVSVRLIDGGLADPTPDNAIVRRLGKDVRYEATRGGKLYSVYQRSFAVVPQQSGELIIPALQFEGLANDPNAASSSVFNPLYSQGRRIFASSSSIKVDVKPPADGFRGKVWLPSNEVSIKEELSGQTELVVGQPVTRKIRLTGVNVSAEQLPEPEIDEVAGIKSYPDQSRLKTIDSKTGVIGSLSIDIAMIGSSIGEVTLPEITVPWWNTETDQMENAILPSRVVRVVENPLASGDNFDNSSGSQKSAALTESLTKEVPAEDSGEQIEGVQAWRWFAILAAGLWLITLGLFLWFYQSRNRQEQTNGQEADVPNLAEYYERIQKACREDNPIAARNALLDWGRARFGRPVLLRQISELVESKKDQVVAFEQELAVLDKALFSPNSANSWRGAEMWRLFEFVSAESVFKRERSGAKLPSLYPASSMVK